MVQFAELRYAPLLLLRPSEVAAVRNLQDSEKKSLFPIFRMRPWASSKSAVRSPEKLIEAMGGAPFGADLDDWWSEDGKKSAAANEFSRMRKNPDLWYNFIKEYECIVPCIRMESELTFIQKTIETDWLVERGFGFVLSQKNASHHGKLFELLPSISHNNYFVVVDAGWSADPLLASASVTATVETIFEINPGSVVFVSSSSFPSSFSEIGINDEVEIREYSLYDEVTRAIALRFNQSTVRYSDWATTRPPLDGGGGGWVPRLDMPEARAVRIFRSRQNDEESVADACTRIAKLIVRRSDWKSPPPSWGHYMVEKTAGGSEFGIYSAQKNTSTRINIHLHNALQTMYEFSGSPSDEPFEG